MNGSSVLFPQRLFQVEQPKQQIRRHSNASSRYRSVERHFPFVIHQTGPFVPMTWLLIFVPRPILPLFGSQFVSAFARWLVWARHVGRHRFDHPSEIDSPKKKRMHHPCCQFDLVGKRRPCWTRVTVERTQPWSPELTLS